MRTKKAIKNIATSLIYQIVSIVCGLIAPRLILSAFGSTYNGVISSANQLLGVVSFLTIGIAGSTRVALYKSLAKKDLLETSRIVKSNKNYMRKVAICVIVYAIVLMILYPYISHNDLPNSEIAILIGILSLSTFGEYFFGLTNSTLLAADQSSYIANIINIFARIANTIAIVLLIRRNCSVFVVYLASSLVFFISPAIMNYVVIRKYKLIRNCEPDDSAIKQRGAVAFHSIANIIHSNTDLVILTLFTDAKVISVYTVYYLVVGKIKSLMHVFTTGMEAAFGDMWVKGEYENLNRNFNTYEFLLYLFCTIVFSCVGLLILPFLLRYTKGINDVEYIRPTLALLITITEGMFCIRQPYLTLVQATGNYEATKKGAMLEAIINIITSVVLVNLIGINGVIVGTLIANLFRTTQYAIFSYKYILHKSLGVAVKKFIFTILTSAMIVLLCTFMNKMIVFSLNWTGWIIQGFITVGIAISIGLISSCCFYRAEIKRAYSLVMRSMKK